MYTYIGRSTDQTVVTTRTHTTIPTTVEDTSPAPTVVTTSPTVTRQFTTGQSVSIHTSGIPNESTSSLM